MEAIGVEEMREVVGDVEDKEGKLVGEVKFWHIRGTIRESEWDVAEGGDV